jgi:hypothetical protein
MLQFRAYIASFNAAGGDTLFLQYVVTDPVWGATNWGDATYVVPASPNNVLYINHIIMYRHAGTLGAGSPISVKLSYTGSASPFVSPGPADPGNNDLSSPTTFTGVWMGLG